ncbi:MAG: restriction endonuclease [Bacteroidetes bacterium]|nr:restriction endonuclease [Bacteroidota bacterium]
MKIFWLDDDPGDIAPYVDFLKKNGHDVRVLTMERQMKELLDSGNIPEIIIQNLYRFNSYSVPAESMNYITDELLDLKGWVFYEEYLKRYYPQIKIIICSQAANEIFHKQKATDFNLKILDKNSDIREELLNTVSTHRLSQEILLDPAGSNLSLIKADFDRVNTELIAYLSKKPKALYDINWATFEKLVTELLRQLGYDVIHTPLTRDGGVDIWAIYKNELGETKYAIDAKHYKPDNLVGLEPIRAIYGVAEMNKASIGMIVTSSSFTHEARRIADQFRYRISLKDFNDIKSWIICVNNKMTSLAP